MGRSTELPRTPVDDLIADHRARVAYEAKQKEERIPRQYASIGGKIPTGGCASIAGEFYYGGAFRYCRDTRTCKAKEQKKME